MSTSTQTEAPKPTTVTGRRPLQYVRFTMPVTLKGTKLPVTTLEEGRPKTEWKADGFEMPQMFLDYDREEVVIGEDRFPRSGGLVGQYRLAAAARSMKLNK